MERGENNDISNTNIRNRKINNEKGEKKDYQKVYEYDFTKLRDIAGEFKYEKINPEDIEGFEIPYDNSYDWIVYLKDGMFPIANVVADREHPNIKAIELSFNTHPNYWRKGYTTEALMAIFEFLFGQGYENILSSYDEGNIKSKNIAVKLGFVLYSVQENAWIKDGVPITTYSMIISKKIYNELYKGKVDKVR